jgi:exonuclease III
MIYLFKERISRSSTIWCINTNQSKEKVIDRKTSRSNQNNQPVSSFKNLNKSNKLVDIWRYLNGNIQQYIWRRKDRSQASRIDLILIGADFVNLVEFCNIKTSCHTVDR